MKRTSIIYGLIHSILGLWSGQVYRGCCASNAAKICVDSGNICRTQYGTETTCNDNIDNDCDGMADCEDSDCAGKYDVNNDHCCIIGNDEVCALSEMCADSRVNPLVPRGVCDSLCSDTLAEEIVMINAMKGSTDPDYFDDDDFGAPPEPYIYDPTVESTENPFLIKNSVPGNDGTGGADSICDPRCVLEGYDVVFDCVPHGCFDNCAGIPTTDNASQQVTDNACFLD